MQEYGIRHSTVLMDHTCLKETEAAQHREISLKLHWNIFKLHISKMISTEILLGSATSFAKSTIQPSAVWIHAFASIFFKAINITSE